MAKVLNSAFDTLETSEADIYTAPSKTMTLLIQAVNTTGSEVTGCQLWLTDGSNTHVACLLPNQSIAAYDGVSDTSKHIIPSGYKIRGTAGTGSAVYVEVSVLEGM